MSREEDPIEGVFELVPETMAEILHDEDEDDPDTLDIDEEIVDELLDEDESDEPEGE